MARNDSSYKVLVLLAGRGMAELGTEKPPHAEAFVFFR
jgi:hypothetical protein